MDVEGKCFPPEDGGLETGLLTLGEEFWAKTRSFTILLLFRAVEGLSFLESKRPAIWLSSSWSRSNTSHFPKLPLFSSSKMVSWKKSPLLIVFNPEDSTPFDSDVARTCCSDVELFLLLFLQWTEFSASNVSLLSIGCFLIFLCPLTVGVFFPIH